MKIIVVGDIHAGFGSLNTLINTQKPDIVLACGDFGYWPNAGALYSFKRIKPGNTKIYWCPGNHEDWHALREKEEKGISEFVPNVFYMKRGSVLNIPEIGNVLFMGGADSIDKGYRTEGIDWFPEEIIGEKDMYNLPDCKIDVVISHTCPNTWDPLAGRPLDYKAGKYKDPSGLFLDEIRKMYKPKVWFFGHWHVYNQGLDAETKWFALDHPMHADRWWMPLESWMVYE